MTAFNEILLASFTTPMHIGTDPASMLWLLPLLASFVVVYKATKVPVGDDQKQHIELTRDLAERFNARYGETFRVPMPMIQQESARIYDLQNPLAKMSKSAESDAGVLWLLDDPAATAKKVMRAVTDSDGTVRHMQIVIGPASQLLAMDADSTVDLHVAEAAAEIRERARRRLPSSFEAGGASGGPAESDAESTVH